MMIPFPDKIYDIIYADPPWLYNDKLGGGGAEEHYPCLTISDLMKLPVISLASSNSSLFLWVTPPHLPHAFEVIDAWGFTYKTVAFTWVKRNRCSPSWFMGLGHYTRSNAELCLIATRGSPRRQSMGVRSVVDTPIERHSKKPDCVRDRIVELYGNVPRIELFARERVDGWDAWGNEI